MPETPLRTPLHARHLAEGARMAPFAGYDMPVQYESVIAEAKAVRTGCGLFDVSHMARFGFEGPAALEFLERVTTNDVGALADRRGQYSLLTNEAGGCVDDVIVYHLGPETFSMVVNAANHAKDASWLRARLPSGAELRDATEETAMIAVQGPAAVELLAGLVDDAGPLREAPAFGVVYAHFAGVETLAARSGYTGEDGFELICAAGEADRLWQALRAAGAAACGLAARDTLRVEAGLPLYGHELGDEINPIAAGLGWVVSKTKAFIGSEPIAAARAAGAPVKLQGLRLGSKRLITPGSAVFVEGRRVGAATSGVYSPMLECGIGFAFIDAGVPLNTACDVELRGRLEPAEVVSKRFYKRG